MEEIVSLPPMEFFNNDYQMILDFIDALGNPKFKIAGNIDLDNNKKINTIGNLVEVDGYLDLLKTNITSLPDNLKINDYLDIRYTQIKSLPDNLHIEGDLYIGFTDIIEIPNNLYILGSLFLGNTPISNKNYKMLIRKMIEDKGGYVGGDIYK